MERHVVRKNPDNLPTTDAIVVLSGMLIDESTPWGRVVDWGGSGRFFGGVELYKLGKSDKLIFTGGIMPWQEQATPEGVVLKRIAQEMGVPEKSILVTDNVQNTEQEALEVRKLLNIERPLILLVTSAYHMPRAQKIFEHLGFNVVDYPVDFKIHGREITPMDFLPSSNGLSLVDTVIRERIGQVYYWFRVRFI